ncbi:hypothetical protein [Bradyrhizobium brasilense]|uniref:hypothetical protein n=1 Tax=Bradyrhizobium brasilense TaxID=1419277 RepID=UPI003CC5B8E7
MPVSALDHLVDGLLVIHKTDSAGQSRRHEHSYIPATQDAPDKRLSQEQSGRTWKFAEILARATDVFGSQEDAEQSLERSAIGLEQRRPIDLLTTPAVSSSSNGTSRASAAASMHDGCRRVVGWHRLIAWRLDQARWNDMSGEPWRTTGKTGPKQDFRQSKRLPGLHGLASARTCAGVNAKAPRRACRRPSWRSNADQQRRFVFSFR